MKAAPAAWVQRTVSTTNAGIKRWHADSKTRIIPINKFKEDMKMNVTHISFKPDLSEEYFFHGGMLLISDTLSTERKLEIIRGCMKGV